MKNFFKNIIHKCKHDYVPWANTHGDWINCTNFRTVLICRKCGKRKYIKDYIYAPLNYGSIWNYLAACKYDGKEFADKNFLNSIFKDKELYIKLFIDKEDYNNNINEI